MSIPGKEKKSSLLKNKISKKRLTVYVLYSVQYCRASRFISTLNRLGCGIWGQLHLEILILIYIKCLYTLNPGFKFHKRYKNTLTPIGGALDFKIQLLFNTILLHDAIS